MNTKLHTKLIIGVAVLIVIIGVFVLMPRESPGPGQYDDFAKCTNEAGLVMYGTEWCSHCKDQKKDFGNSFQYVNYVDCDRQGGVCDAAGVSGYPTWKYNGQALPGKQSLNYLASISGCEL